MKTLTFAEILQKSHLKEQLISASLNELNIAMKNDPVLEKLVTTPAKDLPIEYQNLVEEVAPNMMHKTLYYLIQRSIEDGLISLFSKSIDSIIEGFVSYLVENDEVTGIKMFSLNPRHKDFTFQEDLENFIKDLLSKYRKVSWTALAKNTANRTYISLIKKYNGECDPPESYKKLSPTTKIRYWIENKQ